MIHLATGFAVLIWPAVTTPRPPIAPPPREVPLLFPVHLGAKWEYESSVGSESREVIDVVRSGTAKIATISYVLDLHTGKEKMLEILKIDSDGVLVVGIGKLKFDKPYFILKFPHKPGQEWEGGAPLRGVSYTHQAGQIEEVTVPAGTFKAVKVTSILKKTVWNLRRRIGMRQM